MHSRGGAGICSSPDRRVELVGDGADSDVTPDVVLTGEVDVLAAATDPARVDELVAAGRLHVAGATEAVRQLARRSPHPRFVSEARDGFNARRAQWRRAAASSAHRRPVHLTRLSG